MSNRKKATAFLLEYIDKLAPGNDTVKIYETLLGGMSDAEFNKWVDSLESGDETLFFYTPNLDAKNRLSITRNLELAKELGHEFFQRLVLTDPITGVVFKTPKKYLVIDLPVRRQAQTLQKKISIPEDNRHLDMLTNQPTGPSKGSKISFPEIQVLHAQGLNRIIEELIKFRGGDLTSFNEINRQIMQTGEASMDQASVMGGKVKATETLGVFLKGMHLDNNLG